MLSHEELEKREKVLRLAIEKILPEFVKACRDDTEALIIHQDGFAADFGPSQRYRY